MNSKNRATYHRLHNHSFEIGCRYLIEHIAGHPHCTPNHMVMTSPITKVYEKGRFHTKNTIWTPAK